MPSRSLTTFPSGVAMAVLAMVAGFAAWDAMVRARHVLAVSANYGVTVDAPASAPESPTGYANGRRSLVLPPGAADTAHWIMQTQDMIAAGEWRVRRVDYDNAPHGREVHWAAPLHWWLAAIAWVDHGISGRPMGQSVERAVLYAGPVMFFLMMPLAGWILWRKFSPLAAALGALGAIATYPFYLDFTAGYADHHGLTNLCGLLTVLSLVAGWMDRGGTARWFVASAVAGGVGLWISAATMVPVLLGCGLGLVAAIRAGGRAAPGVPEPDCFRLWGRVGAGVSVAAYLVEYFPSHLGWRLEVNHPLYAIAWLGAGETLRACALAGRNGFAGLSRRDLAFGGVGVALVALLPVVIALTAARTFTVADPFTWRLHALYISEFQGLSRTLSRGLNLGTVALCLPVLCLLPVLGLAFRRSTAPELRALALLALVPPLLGWLMGSLQVRWLGLAYALSVPALALGLRTKTARTWVAAGVLVFLPGLVTAIQRTRAASEFKTTEIQALAERDVAHWLRLRAGSGRVVVAGMPVPTTHLVFSGGLAGLGTLYWENTAGLKQAAALFGAPSAEAAQAMASAGVTHVVLFSWDAFEISMARLSRGLAEDQPMPADSFVAQLFSAPVAPAWLKPIPFPLPDHPSLQGAQVRIWEVTAAQTPAAAAVNTANYYLEVRRPDVAAKLVPLLETFHDELSANVMLAGIASRRADAAAFAAAMERIRGQLPRTAALPLEDHVRLVVVLAVAGQTAPAREQLRRAVAKADEKNLRSLTGGALADLIALMDALEVDWPDPAMAPFARTLLPPGKRSQSG